MVTSPSYLVSTDIGLCSYQLLLLLLLLLSLSSSLSSSLSIYSYQFSTVYPYRKVITNGVQCYDEETGGRKSNFFYEI